MSEYMEVYVSGTPVPQGSMKAFRTGMKTVIVHSKQKELTSWRDRIANAILEKYPEFIEQMPFPQNTPVELNMIFVFERPKSVTIKKRKQMCVKPDGDKCMRGVFDACSKILYYDDSQVMKASFKKMYNDEKEVGLYLQFRRYED